MIYRLVRTALRTFKVVMTALMTDMIAPLYIPYKIFQKN